MSVTKRDVVIAIMFLRGLSETVEAAKNARGAGAYTVGLIDNQYSTLGDVCDERILAPIASQSFAGGYIALPAVIHSIVIALTKCDPARSLKALDKINEE